MIHTRVGELTQLRDMVLDGAQDAEAVRHLVADEPRVRGTDLGVVVVVVPLPVADVAGQGLGQLVPRVLRHEVHHVIADEGGEPARPFAAVLQVAHVCRGGRLHLYLGWVAACGHRRLAHLAGEPSDEVGVGQLEDHAVGDAAGHRQRHRAVAGYPDGQLPASGPRQLQLRSLVRHGATLDEVADHADGLLQGCHRGRRLAQHSAGRVATADAQIHPPAADLVQRRQGTRRHGRLPRGWVRHAGPEAEPLAGGRHQGQEDVYLLPQDVRIEHPRILEAGGLGLAREGERAFDRVVGLEGEPEAHLPPPVGSGQFEGGSVHRLRAPDADGGLSTAGVP